MNLNYELVKHLTVFEGMRLKPYKCSAGKTTIGIGRNLEDKGITPDEAYMMLDNDIREVIDDLQLEVFCGAWRRFPDNVRLVMCSMRFNLGHSGFRGFKRMIAAAKRLDWESVKSEMRDSKWFSQVGHRGHALVDLIDEAIK